MKNKIVYTVGVWDLLHNGHISFLKKAKCLGNKLIVGIQSDDFAKKQKGVLPINSEQDRINILRSIKYVDDVLIYNSYNYLNQFKRINGDVFALSNVYKNEKRFDEIIEYINENNKRIVYLPYDYNISTSLIKEKVIEQFNPWMNIWNRVGDEDKDDYAVAGHLSDKQYKLIGSYITSKLNIDVNDTVLDFGCGSGLILKELNCKKYGIDISNGMLRRATKNCPDGIFVVSDHVAYKNKFNHVISNGVLHYLPTVEIVKKIIEEMISVSDSILLMGLLDIAHKEERIEYKKKMKRIPYPQPLYFQRKLFEDYNFVTFDHEIETLEAPQYSFCAIYKK